VINYASEISNSIDGRPSSIYEHIESSRANSQWMCEFEGEEHSDGNNFMLLKYVIRFYKLLHNFVFGMREKPTEKRRRRKRRMNAALIKFIRKGKREQTAIERQKTKCSF
jgi:hypothetical protein